MLIAGYCTLPDLLCPHTVYSVPTHTWFQSTPLGDHGRCRRVPRGFLSQFPSVQFMYICRDHIYIGHRVSLGRTQVYLPRSEPHSTSAQISTSRSVSSGNRSIDMIIIIADELPQPSIRLRGVSRGPPCGPLSHPSISYRFYRYHSYSTFQAMLSTCR